MSLSGNRKIENLLARPARRLTSFCLFITLCVCCLSKVTFFRKLCRISKKKQWLLQNIANKVSYNPN